MPGRARDAEPEVTVLSRGAGWAAIAKPAGWPVAAERSRPGETPLLDAIARALGVPEVLVVHRLDRDTSGAMLVAWDPAAHRALSLQFQRRAVEKIYWAIVRGAPARDEFEVEAPLEKDPRGGSRMRVARGPGGKRSATRFRTLERFRGFALVEARPLTGRQHQIRVHLLYAGHPLAVDPLYGGARALYLSELKRGYKPPRDRPEAPLVDRATLHALALSFAEPAAAPGADGAPAAPATSGAPAAEPARTTVEAPPPRDFARALDALRRHAGRPAPGDGRIPEPRKE